MFVINVESSLSLLLLINASIHNFFVEVLYPLMIVDCKQVFRMQNYCLKSWFKVW